MGVADVLIPGAGFIAGLFVSGAAHFGPAHWGPAHSGPARTGVEHYRVEAIAVDAGKPALPAEIPEALAKLLDPAGVRVLVSDSVEAKDARPLCEIWLRRELPLGPAPASTSNVKHPRIAVGELVGVLRTFAPLGDYREQDIPAGVHGLRYSQQPADGDHLGTSDTRDFLVVTSLAHDSDPAPVAKVEELIARSTPISPSEHALVLYLAEAPPESPRDDSSGAKTEGGAAAPASGAGGSDSKAAGSGSAKPSLPQFFQRGGKQEWALELRLRGMPEPGKEPERIRAAVVLVGHTAG